MRDKLNLLNTQKTLIHAFFDGFMNGVADANDLKPGERQTLIKTLLNVYEKISEHYAVVMLPILGVVHHESLEHQDQRGTKHQTFGAHHSARLPLWTANKVFIATV